MIARTKKTPLIKPLIGIIISLMLITISSSVLVNTLEVHAENEETTVQTQEPFVTTAQPPTTTAPTQTDLPYDEPLTDDTTNQTILDLLNLNNNNDTLDLVLLVTLLSLAPSILVLMTCFTRIIITFSLLRNAMGVQSTPPNQVMVGLALFLTLFIMTPVLGEINTVAYEPYKKGELTTIEACQAASVPLKGFMLKQTSNESMQFFLDLSGEKMPENTENLAEELPITVVVPAFVISEIKTGFTIGFLLFLPFLIIDIVVSSTLMSMGMIMLSPTMISLPFKILLFILADGWTLLAGALVKGFNF